MLKNIFNDSSSKCLTRSFFKQYNSFDNYKAQIYVFVIQMYFS